MARSTGLRGLHIIALASQGFAFSLLKQLSWKVLGTQHVLNAIMQLDKTVFLLMKRIVKTSIKNQKVHTFTGR